MPRRGELWLFPAQLQLPVGSLRCLIAAPSSSHQVRDLRGGLEASLSSHLPVSTLRTSPGSVVSPTAVSGSLIASCSPSALMHPLKNGLWLPTSPVSSSSLTSHPPRALLISWLLLTETTCIPTAGHLHLQLPLPGVRLPTSSPSHLCFSQERQPALLHGSSPESSFLSVFQQHLGIN